MTLQTIHNDAAPAPMPIDSGTKNGTGLNALAPVTNAESGYTNHFRKFQLQHKVAPFLMNKPKPNVFGFGLFLHCNIYYNIIELQYLHILDKVHFHYKQHMDQHNVQYHSHYPNMPSYHYI